MLIESRGLFREVPISLKMVIALKVVRNVSGIRLEVTLKVEPAPPGDLKRVREKSRKVSEVPPGISRFDHFKGIDSLGHVFPVLKMELHNPFSQMAQELRIALTSRWLDEE
jgi:hypothetical protein